MPLGCIRLEPKTRCLPALGQEQNRLDQGPSVSRHISLVHALKPCNILTSRVRLTNVGVVVHRNATNVHADRSIRQSRAEGLFRFTHGVEESHPLAELSCGQSAIAITKPAHNAHVSTCMHTRRKRENINLGCSHRGSERELVPATASPPANFLARCLYEAQHRDLAGELTPIGARCTLSSDSACGMRRLTLGCRLQGLCGLGRSSAYNTRRLTAGHWLPSMLEVACLRLECCGNWYSRVSTVRRWCSVRVPSSGWPRVVNLQTNTDHRFTIRQPTLVMTLWLHVLNCCYKNSQHICDEVLLSTAAILPCR